VRVPISEYLRALRERVGDELLLLPAVAVLVWDERGRLLLVKERGWGLWQTLGGAVDPGESPQQAALREAREEAGVELRLTGIRAALGGSEYRLTYPNGDRVEYVSTVLDAVVVAGTPAPDGEETSAVGWFAREQLAALAMTEFTRVLLAEAGVTAGR